MTMTMTRLNRVADDDSQRYEHMTSVHGTCGLDQEGRSPRPECRYACVGTQDERKRISFPFVRTNALVL